MLCDNDEGWDGVGGGREVQEGGDVYIPMADWMYEPEENSTEKAGFFYLRTAKDAQKDIRVLACKLKDEFAKKNIDKLK